LLGGQPFVLGGLGFATVTNSREDDYIGNGACNGSISGSTQINMAWTVGGGIGIPVARLALPTLNHGKETS
jgi:hypothetical protein